MADPLSLAFDIGGISSLAKGVVRVLEQYVKGASLAYEPKQQAHTFRYVLTDLGERLEVDVKDFLEENSDGISALVPGGFQQDSTLSQTIQMCKTEIDMIRRMLHKVGIKRTMDKVDLPEWPFSKEERVEIVKRLQIYAKTFHFSQSVSGCKLLSETPLELRGIHERMEAMLEVAPELLSRVSQITDILTLFSMSAEIQDEAPQDEAPRPA